VALATQEGRGGVSDSDRAIIGVQSCGCVTLAIARPARQLDRETQAEIAQIIQSGGKVVTTTVDDARALPNFLPSKCPHKPKGWKPA
jgi:hypothetical protein